MRWLTCSSAARWASGALVLMTTSGFSAPAAAQKSGASASPPAAPAPAPSPDELRAHEIYQQGAAAYREGRFKEAEALLLQAYAIAPKSVLLYNLARVYEGTGDFAKAADAYSRYLDAEPAARDRGALTQRIVTLRAEIAERERLKREHDATLAPERAAPKPVVLPWIVGGVGVAGLVAGGVFGILASSRHSDAQSEYFQQDATRAQADAAGYRDIANVCFVAGGVLAVGGAVWTVLALRANADANASTARQHRGLDVRPLVGLGGVGLEMKGL